MCWSGAWCCVGPALVLEWGMVLCETSTSVLEWGMVLCEASTCVGVGHGAT